MLQLVKDSERDIVDVYVDVSDMTGHSQWLIGWLTAEF